MADDLTKRFPQDARKINVHEPYEVRYWTNKLGVTEQQLKDAVKRTGSTDVEKVRKALGK